MGVSRFKFENHPQPVRECQRVPHRVPQTGSCWDTGWEHPASAGLHCVNSLSVCGNAASVRRRGVQPRERTGGSPLREGTPRFGRCLAWCSQKEDEGGEESETQVWAARVRHPLPANRSFRKRRQKSLGEVAFSFKNTTPAKAWKHLSNARCCFKTF